MVENVKNLIALWPNIQTLAADAGVSDDVARKWRSAGRIPARYFAAILDAAERRNLPVTPRDLIIMHKHTAAR